LPEISNEEVSAAVAAGAIDQSAAESLRAFVEQRQNSALPDEEQFRLITSFNDIFVAVAAVLALSAVAALGASIAEPLGGLALAAAAFALSFEFTLKRRMALPSIVLALGFLGGVVITFRGEVVGVLLAVPAAALHWRRFKVPITPAAGFAALAALLGADGNGVPVLLLGLVGFAWAMWWDQSDRERRTRRSDVAFWLHLLSAGLVVHPLFRLTGLFDPDSGAGSAVTVIALYAGLTLLALAIDRRAMLVAALFYLIWAAGSLFTELGEPGVYVPLTGLVTGGGLLLLSAFWGRARSSFVRRLPREWQRLLPPPAALA
jgi:uncharacterized membrane protein YhaH (DUF805 family)